MKNRLTSLPGKTLTVKLQDFIFPIATGSLYLGFQILLLAIFTITFVLNSVQPLKAAEESNTPFSGNSNPGHDARLRVVEEYGEIKVYDSLTQRCLASGCVGTDNKIYFQINTERGLNRWDKIPRNLRARGSTVFDALFSGCEAFAESMGGNVNGIVGHWEEIPEMTTNYDLFNKALQEGFSPEEAAWKTRTGQWARAKGFDKVTLSNAIGEYGPAKIAEFSRSQPINRPSNNIQATSGIQETMVRGMLTNNQTAKC